MRVRFYCGFVLYRFAFKRFNLPFKAPVRTAHGLWSERDGVWIRLTNGAGQEAYGEAAPIPEFGTETLEEIVTACQGLGTVISAQDIAALPPSCGCLRFAFRSAQAELDQLTPPSSEAGASVSTAIGAGYLPVSALLPAGKNALGKLKLLAEAGFRTFKWKVGVGDLTDELGLLDELLANLPSGAKLRLDANGAWTRRETQRWLERTAERPIEFVEQPIAAGDKGAEDSLLGLAADYPTPLALDESLATGAQIEHWLDLGWPGFFVLKPALIGDLTAALDRIKRSNTRIVFSSALETAIGARGALRTALRFGEPGRAVGFGVWPLFADSVWDGPTLAPFIRREDVERLDSAAAWNALN